MFGRAEYMPPNEFADTELFEGRDATELFPWASREEEQAAAYLSILSGKSGLFHTADYRSKTYPNDELAEVAHSLGDLAADTVDEARQKAETVLRDAAGSHSGPQRAVDEFMNDVDAAWKDEYNPHTRRGAIVAPLGMGKTHFARTLSREVPSIFYDLNKTEGVYTPRRHDDDPDLIIFDDLHYSIVQMQAATLQHGEHVEQDMLQLLADVDQQAQEEDARLVYVTNQSITSLGSRFQDWEHQRMFYDLMDGIVIDEADENRVGESGSQVNVFERDLLNPGDLPWWIASEEETVRREDAMSAVKDAFNVTDIPLTICDCYKESTDSVAEWEDEQATHDLLVPVEESRLAERRTQTNDEAYLWECEAEPIASVRELQVVNEEQGEVSRAALNAEDLGTHKDEFIKYTAGETHELRDQIQDLYHASVGPEHHRFAQFILGAADVPEEDALLGLLQRQMRLETPLTGGQL